MLYKDKLLGLVCAILLMSIMPSAFAQEERDVLPPLPPSTWYGVVQATSNLTPVEGMEVKTFINGIVCGQSQTISSGDQIVFVIHVSADVGDGCGQQGRLITIQIGDEVRELGQWQNNKLHLRNFADLPNVEPTEEATPVPDPTTSTPDPTAPVPDPTTSAPDPTTSAPDPTTSAPDPTTSAPDPTVTPVPDSNIATISDTIWNDSNGNGIYDSDETGLSNVEVQLFSDSDALIQSAVTDSNGVFTITNIVPTQKYFLFFKLPAGWEISTQGVSNSNITIDPATGFTEIFSIASGITDVQLAFGVMPIAQGTNDKEQIYLPFLQQP